MTVDKNKNITAITYNHLNLPTKIIFPTGNIVYFYTASGQKVQKVVTENTTVTTTDYLGGYQYQNTVLQFFPTAEGYVKNTPVNGTNSYSYVFNYTDHLGNTRLSYTKDAAAGSLKILEESNYYPFGLKHSPYNAIAPIPENRRLFNGKELQEELGLNQYDYGARNYDPTLGRWMNIDPLAETSRRFSPYTYALNNPVLFIDPDGMEAKGADGLTNSEWLAANRRSDSPTAQLDAEQKEFDKKQAEIDYFANKNKKKKNVIVGDAEVINSGLNHAMHQMDTPNSQDDPLSNALQTDYNISIVYDGTKIKVLNSKGEVIYEHSATSGKGKHMNKPSSQNVQNEGPIPEGTYSFNTDDWNAQSPARQLYNVIRGNGDWGDYNVRLTPLTYKGSRHSFYLHGGSYPGSAGCIDANAGISQIRNLSLSQSNVRVVVKYGK